MKNNRIYTEDINAAILLKNKMGLHYAVNMFRLTENQAEMVKNGVARGSSINSPSSKAQRQSHHNRVITPRMVEAATGMTHSGFTQKEIAEVFDVDFRTLSENMLQYHGYESKTTNRFRK